MACDGGAQRAQRPAARHRGRVAYWGALAALWWGCSPVSSSLATGDDVGSNPKADSGVVDSGVAESDVADAGFADSIATKTDSANTDSLPADAAIGVQPWRSALFPAAWKPGFAAKSGHALEDYSYAGYHGGGVAIAVGASAVIVHLPAPATDAFDSRADIQAALDKVNGGGVVQLGEGTFRIEGQLFLTASNVVLRGKGADKTHLWFTTHAGMNNKAHVQVGGALKHGADIALLADAMRGSFEVAVADASQLKPGDDVDVGWMITPAFVAAHGMTGTWKAFNGTWQPIFRRAVIAIHTATTPHTVTLDVPLRYDALLRDKASLRPTTGWISEVGIDALSVNNAVDWDAAWTHNQVHAIGLQGVKDGWIRQVQSYPAPHALQVGHMPTPHLQSGGIVVRDSKRVTIADCVMRRAQHRGGGGNGYLFELRTSSEVLTRDCAARHGRHNFIQNWGFGLTGCVWLRVSSSDGRALLGPATDIGTLGYSEFHHSLAMANLLDDSEINDGWASRNRHGYSTGAGQTASRNVIWRVRGGGVIKSYNYGDGFVIGTTPDITVRTSLTSGTGPTDGEGTAPVDVVEGVGLAAGLTPASLYEAQLAKRLAP